MAYLTYAAIASDKKDCKDGECKWASIVHADKYPASIFIGSEPIKSLKQYSALPIWVAVALKLDPVLHQRFQATQVNQTAQHFRAHANAPHFPLA